MGNAADVVAPPELKAGAAGSSRRSVSDHDDTDTEHDLTMFDRSQLAQVKTGKLDDNYEVLEELGSGSFGVVNRGRTKVDRNSPASSVIVAIKRIPKKKVKDTKKLKAEFNVLRQLDHAHICKAYEFYEDHRNIYLVMDICTGGTLLETLCKQRKFSEADAANVMRQILSPLAYLHESNFVFRDLKTENVMFAAPSTDGKIGCVKLIDFGLCCPFDRGTKICKAAGTPYSVAPELVTAPVQYDQKCDSWSAGVVMYILLSGQYPFNGKTKDELLHNIKREPVSFKDKRWKKISREAKRLIAELLKKNAEARCEIIDALAYNWFRVDMVLPDEDIMAGVLESMTHFQSLNMLQKAAITALAWRADDDTTVHLRQIFESIDRDGNGYVTVEELSKTFEMAGVKVPPDFAKLAREAGTDGNNTIEYTEFLAAAIDKRKMLKSDAVWNVFKIFDQNGDGSITKKELLKILTGRTSNKIREVTGDKAIEYFLDKYGTEKEGQVSFDEFMEMLNAAQETQGGGAAAKQRMRVLDDGSPPDESSRGKDDGGQAPAASDAGWFQTISSLAFCRACTVTRGTDQTAIGVEKFPPDKDTDAGTSSQKLKGKDSKKSLGSARPSVSKEKEVTKEASDAATSSSRPARLSSKA